MNPENASSKQSADIDTIITATRWLLTSPETNSGRISEEGDYEVTQVAPPTQVDGKYIRFGRSIYFIADDKGNIVSEDHNPIRLMDVKDPYSIYGADYVPTTTVPQDESSCVSPNLSEAGEWVDVGSLSAMDPKQLERMAGNARTLLQACGVTA